MVRQTLPIILSMSLVTGTKRGFGFVQFSNKAAAAKALKKLNLVRLSFDATGDWV